MKKPHLTTDLLAKGSEKALEIFGFSGLHDSMRKSGMLLESDNVHILSGGAVASMLAEQKIDITKSGPASIAGVYTYYSYYDPDYETPTTAEWVYANVCPSDVLNYAKGMTAASRLLIADVGKSAKTENGYRNVICAFADGETTYVLYDAIYNLIDQRRVDEFEAVGSGYVVQFDSRTNTDDGTFAKVCTLTQVFLDVIDADGSVDTTMLAANLEVQKTLATAYGHGTLVSADKTNFHYVCDDWQPSLGASYYSYTDKVYTDIYPTLATAYSAPENLPFCAGGMVRYQNRENGTAPYGDTGEKLLLLPEMRLLRCTDGTWSVEEASETIPTMDAAVQHFERLFGIDGDYLYASVAGDCTDYTEAVDNLPVSGGWQAVTSDAGGFTAIASFDGKVIVFTAYSMMTVRGTDLPFTLSFEGAYGCQNQESLAVCGGWLYFISARGIFRYNGSRVESISDALPQGIRYADARLTTASGLVVLYFDEFDGLYFYDPASECWSRRDGDAVDIWFVGGESGRVLYKKNGGWMPYDLFGETGNFSFSLALPYSGRRRLRSISVTARLAPGACLRLTDTSGRELFCMDALYDETVTRTFLLRGMYTDGAALHFSGSGDVLLYGVRITYAPMANATRTMHNA